MQEENVELMIQVTTSSRNKTMACLQFVGYPLTTDLQHQLKIFKCIYNKEKPTPTYLIIGKDPKYCTTHVSEYRTNHVSEYPDPLTKVEGPSHHNVPANSKTASFYMTAISQ